MSDSTYAKKVSVLPGRPNFAAPSSARRYVPDRAFSYGLHANRVMQAKEYAMEHSGDPNYNIELYTPEIIEDQTLASSDPFDNPYRDMTKQDLIKINNVYKNLNNYMFDRPGPGPFRKVPRNSPVAELIYSMNDKWVNNPEQNFPGFIWGKTYNQQRYGFGSGEAGYYDDAFDKFPEIILNVPPTADNRFEYLEEVKNQQLRDGLKFNNRSEIIFN